MVMLAIKTNFDSFIFINHKNKFLFIHRKNKFSFTVMLAMHKNTIPRNRTIIH